MLTGDPAVFRVTTFGGAMVLAERDSAGIYWNAYGQRLGVSHAEAATARQSRLFRVAQDGRLRALLAEQRPAGLEIIAARARAQGVIRVTDAGVGCWPRKASRRHTIDADYARNLRIGFYEKLNDALEARRGSREWDELHQDATAIARVGAPLCIVVGLQALSGVR